MAFSSRNLSVLLACLPLLLAPLCASAEHPSYALKGTIVTPKGVISGGAILVCGNLIQAVGGSIPITAELTTALARWGSGLGAIAPCPWSCHPCERRDTPRPRFRSSSAQARWISFR